MVCPSVQSGSSIYIRIRRGPSSLPSALRRQFVGLKVAALKTTPSGVFVTRRVLEEALRTNGRDSVRAGVALRRMFPDPTDTGQRLAYLLKGEFREKKVIGG